jgi:hypothetical protein
MAAAIVASFAIVTTRTSTPTERDTPARMVFEAPRMKRCKSAAS